MSLGDWLLLALGVVLWVWLLYEILWGDWLDRPCDDEDDPRPW